MRSFQLQMLASISTCALVEQLLLVTVAGKSTQELSDRSQEESMIENMNRGESTDAEVLNSPSADARDAW